MTLVFGSCIEPGGMELDNDRDEVECPMCHGKAVARTWEACEGGSLNIYSNLHCTKCNHFEGDTGEGDDYDHLFGNDEPDDIKAFYAQILAEEECIESQSAANQALGALAWLTKSDFLVFAAGVRQAA